MGSTIRTKTVGPGELLAVDIQCATSCKRVVVCIPCLNLGGSELATLSLVKALTEGDYDVAVCCYYEHDAAMVERFKKAGARVELLGLSRGSLRHLFSTMVKYFRSQHPDVVHVQYFAPGMVPILAARRAGVQRIFATVHAAGQHGYGWKAKAMLRFAARFTDHFFCVSQNAERFWFGSTSHVGARTDWSKIRHSTIYNCVGVETIQAAGQAADRRVLCPSLPANAKVIGIVGRLVRLKGHLTLLQAMRTIIRQAPDTFLLVIGEGPDEALFRQEARTLGVEQNVIWKGRIEPEVLPQYYHIMDVLAMPSHWEGFGLTAAEAMAAGKPVVGTDVSGLREVVEDGVTGFLVPVGDAEALARRLIALLSDESTGKAMGLQGLDRVRRCFDVGVHDRRWCEAYASLLDRRRGEAAYTGAAPTE
ncbi:MAG TPA: glycosyltransferase [Sedimentisphaerales bacterium]|nr:glycosyltransferase [Sedimentisphaerales bacterium]